jgi:hypothetical protein
MLSMLALNVPYIGAHTSTYLKSGKVALVPNATANRGGSLYTGTSWPNGDSFTFTNVAVADIGNGASMNPIITGDYDTIVIMAMDFDFGAAWGNSIFSSRIQSFVNEGGKLIIYTSEATSATAFSSFVYPFTVDTPGQTGSHSGTITNLLNDTFSSTDPNDVPPASPGAYVNLTAIATLTDAVGDLTVMTSYDPHWSIDLFATNVNNVGGPAHTYAFYGMGLIIFNGLDLDNTIRNSETLPPTKDDGGGDIEMIWWRELCNQALGPGPNVNGLTLDPAAATNFVGTNHTVTATVRSTINNNPLENVAVNFNITAGPNMNLTGQATTNVNGQSTFIWSSSIVGTDTLSAIISNNNQGDPPIITTATKTWVSHGALNVSVSPSSWTMDLGQTQQFTATPNGGSGSYTSYDWIVNGSVKSGQTAPTFNFAPVSSGLYPIAAAVTDNMSTTSPYSAAALVTVNPAPTVSIAPVGPLTMDAGQNQKFTATPTGGSGMIHYQWYLDGGKVGSDSSIYTYTAAGTSHLVTCKVTDNASVPVTSPDSNAVKITVNPTPTPSPTPSPMPTQDSNSSFTSSTSPDLLGSQNSTSPDLLGSQNSTSPDLLGSQNSFPFRFEWWYLAIIVLMSIVVFIAVVVAYRTLSDEKQKFF